MSTSRPDPRYRPSGSSRPGPKPPPSPEYLRRLQLAKCPRCQWQSRAIRCVAEATDVVCSREGVPRSTCEKHLPAWLRAGGRRLI